VDSVAFSPNGETLAVGESDGVVLIWKLDVNDVIRQICDLTAGALTDHQRQAYIPELPYNPPCASER
jgi:WD40 repeat protein